MSSHGYIVTADGPEDYIELHGTLVISEQGLAISGKWSSGAFELKTKTPDAVNIKHLGKFSFNGSFDFAGERVPEKCVEILVSRDNTSALSINGYGMNKLGVFKLYGKGKSSADGSKYKVSLRKTYILEDGSRTILWKMHSVDGSPSFPCVGEVTSFDMKQTKVRVLFYKDGNFEWLNLEEAIGIATTHAPTTNVNRNPINKGARISKYFLLHSGKSKQFLGRVISSHPGDRYMIKFDDDSQEEMGGDLVRHLLDCTERRQLELVSISNEIAPKTNAKIATASEVIELLDDDDDDDDDIMNRKSCEADRIDIEDCLKGLKVAKCKLEVAEMELELHRATQHKGTQHKGMVEERMKATKVKLEDTVDLQALPTNQKRARVSL